MEKNTEETFCPLCQYPTHAGHASDCPIKSADETELRESDPAQETMLRLQERDTQALWDQEAGLIINGDDKNPGYEKQLTELIQKYERSTYVEPQSQIEDLSKAGMWTKMMFEIINDPKLADLLQSYQSISALNVINEQWDTQREIKTLERFSEKMIPREQQHQNIIFLNKLLSYTPRHFRYEAFTPPDEYKTERDALVRVWSEIFTGIQHMRVEKIKARLEKSLPDIATVKSQILERDQATISQAAKQRIMDTHVIFGDEYIDYGTEFERGMGVYISDAKPPYVRVSGHTTLNPARTKRNISHEFEHVRSGHGNIVNQTENTTPTEQHLISSARVGVSSTENPHLIWLNEAITEERNGKRLNIPSGEQSYPKSRTLKETLIYTFKISSDDLNEWYETEGDDHEIQKHLGSKYPTLFQAFTKIDQVTTRLLKESSEFDQLRGIEGLSDKNFDQVISLVQTISIH